MTDSELHDFIHRLAEHLCLAACVIGARAERREWTLTEHDYPLE